MSNFIRLATIVVLLSSPALARAQEPTWNAEAARGYLDDRAKWWRHWPSSARGQATACISCHTSLPYALARPALGAHLGETEPGELELWLIANVQKRVTNWDKITGDDTGKDPFRPFYAGQRRASALGTEAVVNALVLTNHDRRRGKGVLSEPTKKALGHLWSQQQADGGWLWLDFGLNPWETEASYFGASLAGLAVGMAGEQYAAQDDVAPKAASLQKYLATHYATQRLHHRMFVLWASSRWPGAIGADQKKNLIAEILDAREADGGWSSPKLGRYAAKKGTWKSEGTTSPAAKSDGYATGLAVLALRGGGLPRDHAQLKKGIAWLEASQKEGIWAAHYLNKSRDPESDVGKFMRDAATAFATLALIEAR